MILRGCAASRRLEAWGREALRVAANGAHRRHPSPLGGGGMRACSAQIYLAHPIEELFASDDREDFDVAMSKVYDAAIAARDEARKRFEENPGLVGKSPERAALEAFAEELQLTLNEVSLP